MSTTQTIVVDTDNQFDWDQITSVFNDAGVLTSRLTDFDNGNTKQEYFDGTTGARDALIEKDIADVEDWVQIFTLYDSGGMATKTTSFDNGVTREERIQPELGDEAPAYVSARIEYDDGDAFGWASRGSTYAFNGDLNQSFVRFDNGIYDGRSYQGGVLSARTQQDTGDIAAWDTIETFYDQTGQLAERITRSDNGIVKYDTFENGVRASTYQGDNIDETNGAPPADGGVKNWETIETFFDEGGQLAERIIRYDNGVVKYDTFENGVRASTYQGDNIDETNGAPPADGGVKNWETIETFFDEGGQLAERIIRYDNGVVKYDTFENGVRASTYQGDNIDETNGAPPADGGAKNWETIETLFDQSGQIEFKTVVYDNGSTAETLYQDGERSVMLQSDIEDVFVWNIIVTEYDEDGNIATKSTEWDNGDQLSLWYAEQELLARIEIDRDGSETWAAKLTDYQSGQAVVMTYDDVMDLPDPYAGFFGDVAYY